MDTRLWLPGTSIGWTVKFSTQVIVDEVEGLDSGDSDDGSGDDESIVSVDSDEDDDYDD